jgi:hypothetical protein
VLLTPVANLPPVSITPAVPVAKFAPMVNFHLKKFEMTRMLFSGAWGKMVYEKNLKQKIL